VTPQRGPNLPYNVVAGVTPWGGGWFVVSAKMHGSTFAAERPHQYETFLDVLSERPSFSVVVMNAPIGYLDLPEEHGRVCDHEARLLLGRRGATVHNAPSRAVVEGRVPWEQSGLDAITGTLLPRYREVAAEMSPFRQRVVFEGQPELSFYQMNKDTPLRHSKKSENGYEERLAILVEKIPAFENIVAEGVGDVPIKHLFDAAALLWTARRISGRAALRIPAEAQWDSEGLRMEFVY
jgi:predicted RNase H-like nuclease